MQRKKHTGNCKATQRNYESF